MYKIFRGLSEGQKAFFIIVLVCILALISFLSCEQEITGKFIHNYPTSECIVGQDSYDPPERE